MEHPTQTVPADVLISLLSALERGLEREETPDCDPIESYERFRDGEAYDSDPLRRYVRSHGGHCSGGGGCS